MVTAPTQIDCSAKFQSARETRVSNLLYDECLLPNVSLIRRPRQFIINNCVL